MTTRRMALGAMGGLLAPGLLRAQSSGAAWKPSRPVRMIVTYPPGGVNDIVGRIVAEPLGAELGQPVVVENRAGAGGNIGTLAAAQAEPDGHTILFGTTAMFGVNPVLYQDSGVNAAEDFLCLGTIGEVANVLSAVPKRNQARTVQELIAEARRRPLVYGSVGNGSSSHLSAVVFLKAAGIEATHVPYRGSSPLVAAMLAGDVDFGFDTTATSTGHIRSGGLRPLGVTTARRASALPDVPTLREAGIKDYDLGIWFGLHVPVRTPAPIFASLQNALLRTRTAQTTERLQRAFVDPLAVPGDQLQEWVKKDSLRWQAIAREAGIRAD
ncbi:Bug family tripartite tricarboxylate transporter substrate binding protein [Teichococcus oryzae]|uniref:Tripartite tricarboxylate transporter substrate binding protein n=1 Tax=Teichococcus oryzae TaxID=1608942 RepID=A0A5B2TGR4_9PROT|nr:tripartite tricarboxylate transporter substrate binding protein [Pseudoroseomonas oryzae]KAA2213185.1 tripartite tricarboxylate transporter substrate binding protein [Pseudoroseomonas oryzae]